LLFDTGRRHVVQFKRVKRRRYETGRVSLSGGTRQRLCQLIGLWPQPGRYCVFTYLSQAGHRPALPFLPQFPFCSRDFQIAYIVPRSVLRDYYNFSAF
jgi:hypothetical protein